MHSVESTFVIGPSNILFGGVYLYTFQPGNFTGWGLNRNAFSECSARGGMSVDNFPIYNGLSHPFVLHVGLSCVIIMPPACSRICLEVTLCG